MKKINTWIAWTTAAILAFSSPVFADSKTIVLDAWRYSSLNDVSQCGISDGRGGIASTTVEIHGMDLSASFWPNLPLGAVLTDVTVRAWMTNAYNADLVDAYLVEGAWLTGSPYIDGPYHSGQIGAEIDFSGTPRIECPSAGGTLIEESFTKSKPGGFDETDGYNTSVYPPTQHPQMIELVVQSALNDGTPAGLLMDPRIEVTLTWQPPIQLDFDLSDSTPDEERSVLISTSMDESSPNGQYHYLSPEQHTDRRIQIRAKATRGGVPQAGVPIYFWLEDPKSTAPYEPTSGPTVDNFDQVLGGYLAFRMVQGNILSNVSGTTDANGYVETELTVTDQYAGDNYRIIASTNPSLGTGDTYSCFYSPCARSGIITAWKRIYLENDSMYRKGSLLDRPAVSASTEIHVLDATDFRGASQHQTMQVTLLHAPWVNLPSPDLLNQEPGLQTFYEETNAVTDVILDGRRTSNGPNPGRLVLERPLAHWYGPESPGSYQADGVVILQGGTFAADDRFLSQKTGFKAAFVDVQQVQQNSLPLVPHVNFPGTIPDSMADFAEKWSDFSFRNHLPVLQNHVYLSGGDRWAAAVLGGTNPAPLDVNYSFVFVGTIEQQVNGPSGTGIGGLNAATVDGEVLVHELAHHFSVNGGPFIHCSGQKIYDNSGYCTMKSPAEQEAGDGRTGFHFSYDVNGKVTSEYLDIRSFRDPLVR